MALIQAFDFGGGGSPPARRSFASTRKIQDLRILAQEVEAAFQSGSLSPRNSLLISGASQPTASITLRKAIAAASSTPSISLPSAPRPAGAVSGQKLAGFQCRARGGELVLGRCVQLKTVPAPGRAPGAQRIFEETRPPGGTAMGIRAQLISPGFLPSGPTLLGGLIQGGLDIVNTLVASKFGATGVGSPSPTPLAPTLAGGLIPTGGPIGMATVIAAVAAVGGAVVGTVIRVTRAGWARIPSLIKQAAIALGLTLAITDAELIGGGGGTGELSMTQQRKIDRFQQLTGAGVPPGLAARAVGIGKRRRRGISAFELSGFRKVSHLLGHVGMVPRGLRGARPTRGHHHHK